MDTPKEGTGGRVRSDDHAKGRRLQSAKARGHAALPLPELVVPETVVDRLNNARRSGDSEAELRAQAVRDGDDLLRMMAHMARDQARLRSARAEGDDHNNTEPERG